MAVPPERSGYQLRRKLAKKPKVEGGGRLMHRELAHLSTINFLSALDVLLANSLPLQTIVACDGGTF